MAEGADAVQAAAPAASLGQVERADQLIGQAVLGSDHQRLGKIDDFVIDPDSGRILYAIVGMGGILGVGETRFAVPPSLFTEARKGAVRIDLDKHKLARAPQLPADIQKQPTADFLSNDYGYFGQPAWWEGAGGTATNVSRARTTSQLKSMAVQDSSHQEIGKVASVVLDVPAGREVYVVLSPSSGLGLGNELYALPSGVVKLGADEKTLVAEVTREKLAQGPHFTKDNWAELSNAAWGRQVYQYYGQTPSLRNDTVQPTGRR